MNLTAEFGKVIEEIIDSKRKLGNMRRDIEEIESRLDGLHAWLLGLHPGNPVSPLAPNRLSDRVRARREIVEERT